MHPDAIAQHQLQVRQQLLGTLQCTGDRVADSDCQRGRRQLPRLRRIEVMIEAGHFEHLRGGEPQLRCQRHHLSRADITVLVLDQVQMFDQQIGPAQTISQQRLNLS